MTVPNNGDTTDPDCALAAAMIMADDSDTRPTKVAVEAPGTDNTLVPVAEDIAPPADRALIPASPRVVLEKPLITPMPVVAGAPGTTTPCTVVTVITPALVLACVPIRRVDGVHRT